MGKGAAVRLMLGRLPSVRRSAPHPMKQDCTDEGFGRSASWDLATKGLLLPTTLSTITEP